MMPKKTILRDPDDLMLAFQENEYQRRETSCEPYLDIENGQVLWLATDAFLAGVDEDENERLRERIEEEEDTRYFWIPPFRHSEDHENMDKFISTLDDGIAERLKDIRGIGDIIMEGDNLMDGFGIGWQYFRGRAITQRIVDWLDAHKIQLDDESMEKLMSWYVQNQE